jgi:hypothetical protein
VAFFSQPGCVDYLTGFSTQSPATFDSWELLSRNGWTPTGAVSALIVLSNNKTGAGDFQTFHDCAFFGPNPTMIFEDGFETMDTSQWSQVTGELLNHEECATVP